MYICMQYLSSKNIWYINVLYIIPTSLSNPAAHMFYWLTMSQWRLVCFPYWCCIRVYTSPNEIAVATVGHQQILINIVINMSGNGQLLIIKVRIMSSTFMYSERLNWYDMGISQNHEPKSCLGNSLILNTETVIEKLNDGFKVYPTETTFKIPAPDL